MDNWKDIEGFEGYSVNDAGDVLTTRQGRNRLLKPGIQSKGFRLVMLYNGSTPKRPKSFLVSRLVAEAFLPPRSGEQTDVVHLDGDKENDAATNLKWMSAQEARTYQFEKGFVNLDGKRNGNHKSKRGANGKEA